MMRPIRSVNAWNVFVEGGEDDKIVLYRLRWAPAIGGTIRVANDVARDWRDLSLEDFARKYFRPGFARRRRE
jgi:hypothetical protein